MAEEIEGKIRAKLLPGNVVPIKDVADDEAAEA